MATQEYLERKSEKRKVRQQEQVKKNADIGELHSVVNPVRRHLCSWNLGLWLQTYFPESTGLGPFSTSHYGVIDSLESCLLGGGWYANSVFREFAKTSISEGSALWAILNAHRRFCPIFGADAGAADQILESMLMELNENDLLFEDFPEVCVAFRHLQGVWQKAPSQTYEGERTYIDQSGGNVILPTIRLTPEASRALKIPCNAQGFTLCSGGILSSEGLLSAKRGKKHKRPDGTQQRPDAAIIDDPQTDRSAESPAEIGKRLRIIRKAIIPMAGQRKKLALIVNGTTIVVDDVMEQLLNPDLSKAWQGRRIPMLKSRSKNESMWIEDYARILTTWDRTDPSGQDRAREKASEFYVRNRDAMDEGAEATWHTCYSRDQREVSAIQHAYNVLLEQGEEVFESECQQKPKRIGASVDEITLSEIISLSNGLARGVAPLWTERITIMTDVQDDAIYWLALATGDGFRGHVVDYGIYPEQNSNSLLYADVKRRLRDIYGGTMESALQSGLDDVIKNHYAKTWSREGDGATFRPDVGADSSDNTTTVYAAVRPTAAIPTKGRAVGAKQAQWVDFPEREGEQISREYHWLLGPTKASKGLRLFQYDVNWWKTFVTRRMRTPKNAHGSLSLFGQPADHVHFATHCKGEYSKAVTVDGRTVIEWMQLPGKDNHLWDCLVGAHALAARSGANLTGVTIVSSQPVRRTFSLPGARRG